MKIYVVVPNRAISDVRHYIYVGKEKDAKKIVSMFSDAYYEIIPILNSVEVEEICRTLR